MLSVGRVMVDGGRVECPSPSGPKEHTSGVKRTFSLKNRFFCSRCQKKAFQSEETIFLDMSTFEKSLGIGEMSGVEKTISIKVSKSRFLCETLACWWTMMFFRGQKSLSTKVRLSRTASIREWPTEGRPTTNCELSLTIHIKKSNREFKHTHLAPNVYRWHT